MFDESDKSLCSNCLKHGKKMKFGVEVCTLCVKSKKQEKECKKQKGDYVIVNCEDLYAFGKPAQKLVEQTITSHFKRIVKKFKVGKGLIFVVGLGNPNLLADSLGNKVVEKLLISNILPTQYFNFSKVCALTPDVCANTGIDTFKIVKAVSSDIKPNLIIIVDSLGTYEKKRLATSFQISTSSIVAGGSLGMDGMPFSKKTLGVPTIIIGVPLLLINSNDDNHLYNILCPKNIDECVDTCSNIIASCINHALHRQNKTLDIL